MTNPVVIVVLVLAFVALFSLLYTTFKSRNVDEEKPVPASAPETYTGSLQKTTSSCPIFFKYENPNFTFILSVTST